MKINTKDLNECPVLSAYERELLRRVYVDGETQSAVAKSLKKDPSTISIQLKKAFVKFDSWMQSIAKRGKVSAEEDLGKKVFRLFRKGKLPDAVIAEIGRVDEVSSLWNKYTKLRGDDYYQCLSTLNDYDWEVDQDSKHPVSDMLEFLLSDYSSSLEERKLILKVVEDTGLIKWVGKPGILSPLDAVKRLAEGFDHVVTKAAKAHEASEYRLPLK
jgi:hypothetical protein